MSTLLSDSNVSISSNMLGVLLALGYQGYSNLACLALVLSNKLFGGSDLQCEALSFHHRILTTSNLVQQAEGAAANPAKCLSGSPSPGEERHEITLHNMCLCVCSNKS